MKKPMDIGKYYEKILASIGNPLSIQDTKFKILFQNQVHIDIIGNRVGEYCYKAYENRDEACHGCPLLDTFKDGQVHTNERELPGSVKRIFEITTSPLKDQNGKIIAGIEIVTEITERKKIENALRNSEEKYRVIFEQAADSIFTCDADGYILDFNDLACQHLGYTREELKGMHISKFEVFESQEEVRKHVENIIKNSWDRFKSKHRRKNGEIRDVEVSVKNIVVEGKNLNLAICHDITSEIKAAEKLKSSEEQYRGIFETTADALMIADLQGVFVEVNPAACSLYGYPREELIGMKVIDLISPDSRYLNTIDRTVPFNEDIFIESLDIRKDGTIINVGMKITTFNFKGKPHQLAIIRDITERKRVEKTLKESEAKFRELAEQSPNMIFINKKGRVVYANKMCETIMGYTKEEFLSPAFDFLTLVDHESIPLIHENYRKHMLGEEVSPYEYSIRTKEGEKIIAIINTKLLSYEGEPAILGVLTNITELRHLDNILRIERDIAVKLSSINNLKDALSYILKRTLEIEGIDSGGIYIVDSLTKALDLVTHKGLSDEFINYVSHYDKDSASTKIAMAGKPAYFDFQNQPFVLNDLQKIENIKALAVIPVLNDNCVIAAFNLATHKGSTIPKNTRDCLEIIATSIGSAITRIKAEEDLKHLKNDLERQNIELKKLDRIKNALLSDVTHELKTPVAKQWMQLELLKRFLSNKGLLESCSKVINIMEQSIERQNSVINNILDLSRLEKGGRKYIYGPFQIDALIQKVVSDYKSTIESYKIEIELKLTPITIISDQEMLYHAFSNLLNNAIKFRDSQGKPTIKMDLTEQEEKVIFRISDNGIGLSPEEIEKVFERFYQVSASIPGSGIGLTITKIVVEDLKGNIWLESAGKGQGTTAIVELPKHPNI